MATTANTSRRAADRTSASRRLTTETKSAFKTTEFIAMVAIAVGILISAAVIKGGDTGGTDEFIARQAWLYVAIVAAQCCAGPLRRRADSPTGRAAAERSYG